MEGDFYEVSRRDLVYLNDLGWYVNQFYVKVFRRRQKRKENQEKRLGFFMLFKGKRGKIQVQEEFQEK